MTIEEILSSTELSVSEKLSQLKAKTINVPIWGGSKGLVMEFDPTKHPVMDKQLYPDVVSDEGVERVTRITCDLQRLAVKRMTELCCGIPVKRVYKPETDLQKELSLIHI